MCNSKNWVHTRCRQLSVEILQLRPIISRQQSQERKNNEALLSHQIDKVVFHSMCLVRAIAKETLKKIGNETLG